ncbi:hypothetical protein, partial [Bacillus phage SPG24]
IPVKNKKKFPYNIVEKILYVGGFYEFRDYTNTILCVTI